MLCVAITSASDRNNFLSGPGVVQDLYYIKTKGEKKAPVSLSENTLKQGW